MNKPEDGLYVARVTEGNVEMMHADEDAVCDHQTQKLFEGRAKAQEAAETQKQEDAQRLAEAAAARDYAAKLAEKQTKKRKRCRNCMIKDVVGFIAAAWMAIATYSWGMYALIAVVSGCTVAAVCRVVAYASKWSGE